MDAFMWLMKIKKQLDIRVIRSIFLLLLCKLSIQIL